MCLLKPNLLIFRIDLSKTICFAFPEKHRNVLVDFLKSIEISEIYDLYWGTNGLRRSWTVLQNKTNIWLFLQFLHLW
jgi:hypothetical protein